MTSTAQDTAAQLDQRAQAAEPAVVTALMQWWASLAAALALPAVVEALATGTAAGMQALLAAVPTPSLPMLEPALQEAKRALALVAGEQRPDLLQLGFDMVDPGFADAVDAHGAKLVTEVTDQIKATLDQLVKTSYASGLHPYDFAPVIRDTVGLTSRQAAAVTRMAMGLAEQGVTPQMVERRAGVYADRLLAQRAKAIARTETLRALVDSRIAGFQAAADRGLIDRETAELVWVASDDACDICAALDGTTAPLDEGFAEGPPEHTNCRCAVSLQQN